MAELGPSLGHGSCSQGHGVLLARTALLMAGCSPWSQRDLFRGGVSGEEENYKGRSPVGTAVGLIWGQRSELVAPGRPCGSRGGTPPSSPRPARVFLHFPSRPQHPPPPPGSLRTEEPAPLGGDAPGDKMQGTGWPFPGASAGLPPASSVFLPSAVFSSSVCAAAHPVRLNSFPTCKLL